MLIFIPCSIFRTWMFGMYVKFKSEKVRQNNRKTKQIEVLFNILSKKINQKL